MAEEETIAFLLQSHSSPLLPSPQQCLLLHARMVCFGLDQKTHLANVLLHRYAKSMEISSASVLFNKIHERDVVSWNTMMGAYANAQDERHHAQAVPCHVQKVQPHPKEVPHYAQMAHFAIRFNRVRHCCGKMTICNAHPTVSSHPKGMKQLYVFGMGHRH